MGSKSSALRAKNLQPSFLAKVELGPFELNVPPSIGQPDEGSMD
jgi:hypothetical protein